MSGLKAALRISEFCKASLGKTTVEQTDLGYILSYGEVRVKMFLTFDALTVFLEAKAIESG